MHAHTRTHTHACAHALIASTGKQSLPAAASLSATGRKRGKLLCNPAIFLRKVRGPNLKSFSFRMSHVDSMYYPATLLRLENSPLIRIWVKCTSVCAKPQEWRSKATSAHTNGPHQCYLSEAVWIRGEVGVDQTLGVCMKCSFLVLTQVLGFFFLIKGEVGVDGKLENVTLPAPSSRVLLLKLCGRRDWSQFLELSLKRNFLLLFSNIRHPARPASVKW